jgi:hypothetical protein
MKKEFHQVRVHVMLNTYCHIYPARQNIRIAILGKFIMNKREIDKTKKWNTMEVVEPDAHSCETKVASAIVAIAVAVSRCDFVFSIWTVYKNKRVRCLYKMLNTSN